MPNSKLPERPSLEYLKKLAKQRLQELHRTHPDAKLATALLEVAREYGFTSWRALKAQIDGHRARKIASPVMRFLPVADADCSVAFYRDVLGFEIKENEGAVEAVLGPARIRFGKEGYAPTDWQTPRTPGSAILFLQADDIAATHAAIRGRGGSPSNVERVNWIKMRMFEVRDPDRNVLWFGQSFHKDQDSPSRRDAQPAGLRQALPALPFDDVPAAVAYYRDVLGFHINYQQADLGVMDRDAITVLLIARTAEHKGIGSFSVYVSDADALYAELSAKGAKVLGPPVSRPWGLRDFTIVDAEGNRITFAQTFE
ncbi:MAG TPA: VOC family protein [Candidatus Sulfotelmatobacter sp.]|nr:VOC family protein [Candidatus Sulfotelmatobacter sp.]